MTEALKLYRFRIWHDLDKNSFRFDKDVYTHDVPVEMLEFHQPGIVYTIRTFDNEHANVDIILVLSDNKEKISDFVRGIMFACTNISTIKIDE